MKKVLVVIAIFSLFACKKSVEIDINQINGYWEIEEVQLVNGEKRIYSINKTIDYFKVNNNLQGFRKKLNIDLLNGFSASNHQENIRLKFEGDSLNIYYNSTLSTRKETILEINSDNLKIITQNKDVYLYKRFKPISIE